MRLLAVDRIVSPRTGVLYLWRLRLVDCRAFGVYLHRFHAPDQDRYLHDHPFSFLSLVLWGWYDEEVRGSWRRVRWFNWKPAPGAHRVVRISPRLWTLVVRGPRVREWGFYTPTGWVDWRTFLGEEAAA